MMTRVMQAMLAPAREMRHSRTSARGWMSQHGHHDMADSTGPGTDAARA